MKNKNGLSKKNKKSENGFGKKITKAKNGDSSKKSWKKKSPNERKILHSVDKVMNSPSATKKLLNVSMDSSTNSPHKSKSPNKKKNKKNTKSFKKDKNTKENGSKPLAPGHLLKQGIKFSSQDEFTSFMGSPEPTTKKKNRKNKKRKLSEGNTESPPPFTGAKNPAFDGTFQENDWGSDTESTPIRKKSKVESKVKAVNVSTTDSVHHRMKKAHLQEILSSSVFETTDAASKPQKQTKKTFFEKAKDRLNSSRFRYINEMLYTQTSSQSVKMFEKDASMYEAYHQGFQQQANNWPMDPLDRVIKHCTHLPKESVIADMGCGEARLAKSLPNHTVHSFDLMSKVPGVIQCDMSKVPLPDQSVDVVVFCLSLMGTNIKDFLCEAYRILKMDGILRLAELESRFHGEEKAFVTKVHKYGFKMRWQNTQDKFFVFYDFIKIKEQQRVKKGLPAIVLKPCLYKKR